MHSRQRVARAIVDNLALVAALEPAIAAPLDVYDVEAADNRSGA
jgi:hypothetical protein